jgi:predicted dehydrogenase
MSSDSTRRDFIKQSGLATAGFWLATRSTFAAESNSPNEKLNIAGIGAGGKGYSDVFNCRSENIVAICDVDEHKAGSLRKDFPKAKFFRDFRQMFDKMHKEIDAVVVATPDHTHAYASMMAINHGKHIFCEKPLTHDVYEARLLADSVREKGLASQMGNQGTALPGLREGVEVIQSGAIGEITEVHTWTNRPVWPQGTEAILRLPGVQCALKPQDVSVDPRPTPPAHFDWDLWLGTAPERHYYPNAYHSFNWRGWWDFGTGAIGDMAMHTANMAWMACGFKHPLTIEAVHSGYNSETFPTWSVITFEFPNKVADKPPVKWVWYDGGKDKPDWVKRKLEEVTLGEPVANSGSCLIGTKGRLYSPNDYGAEYRLLPKEQYAGYEPPAPTLPRAEEGHYMEWINACKGGPAAMSNFDYAAPFTETFLLGLIALRVNKKLEWDGPNMTFTNAPEANQYLKREYRKGWEI